MFPEEFGGLGRVGEAIAGPAYSRAGAPTAGTSASSPRTASTDIWT